MKALVYSILSLSLIASSHAATTFLTNNTSPKTLASNEGDAIGLNGDATGDSTVLTLSADDGGGAITFTTINTSGDTPLNMDGDSMGHGNDKWGNSQNWTFAMDQTVSFDALTFKTINETMTLSSSAWVGTDSNAEGYETTGSNWGFEASTGTFDILGTNGPGTYDFTSAGVSNVAAGTAITFGFLGSAGGGEELTSFTISPVVIPEPSTALLSLIGMGFLLRRKRR